MTGPLVAVALAYLLAALPVGCAVLAGRITPMYACTATDYLRWWSWGACLIIGAAYLLRVA